MLAPSITFPLVATVGWRWVFYLSAAPGLLCVLLVLRFAPFLCFGFVLYGLMSWLPTYLGQLSRARPAARRLVRHRAHLLSLISSR